MTENKPPSIVLISQYFPPETGAAPTRWDELISRWSENADITVITSAPDYPEGELYEGYENTWIRRDQREGVDVIYTKTITSASGNLVRRSLKFVWFMLLSLLVGIRYSSPEIVVATSPQPLTGVSAWLLARVKGGKFVFEVRDLWPESITAVSDFDNRFVIGMLDRTVLFLYKRADKLVVVTRAFIEPIVERDVDPAKIEYYPNAINPDFYTGDGGSPASVLNLKDTFTVSYIGTIGRAHGLSVVLDVACDLPDVQFVLVGDGAERETLERKAKDLENVVFTGRRPKEEVPHYLAASDVALVHLKPREIFETVLPSKMLEAMAGCLPVILGVRGESERILTEAEAGIAIEPGNAEELRTAVKRLKNHPEECNEFGESGREYVVEHFNWETIASEYLETITGSPNTVTRSE